MIFKIITILVIPLTVLAQRTNDLDRKILDLEKENKILELEKRKRTLEKELGKTREKKVEVEDKDSYGNLIEQYDIRLGYSGASVDPEALNQQLREVNQDAKNLNINGFAFEEVDYADTLEFYFGRRATKSFSAGIFYNKYSHDQSAQGTLDNINPINIKGAIDISVTTIGVRGFYNFKKYRNFEFYGTASFGFSSFDLEIDFQFSDTTANIEVAYSAQDYSTYFQFGGGTNYYFNDSFAIYGELGLISSSANEFEVKSEKNTGYTIGDRLEWDGNDAEIDFSGSYLSLGVQLSFK